MKTIIIILSCAVLIPAIILIWFILISEIKESLENNLRKKLKEAALKSDEALLDYIYNYFNL
jgi:sensor histidine kinase regulating citrate/malate metabolism